MRIGGGHWIGAPAKTVGVEERNGLLVRWLEQGPFDVELEGATVYPGLIDTHLHLSAIGQSLSMAQLHGLDRLDDVEAAIDRIAPDPDGIRWGIGFAGAASRSWFHTRFPGERIVLLRADLHSAWVSPKLLESVADVHIEGGEFGRDAHGELNGWVVDRGLDQVGARFERDDPDKLRLFIERGVAACVDAGLTEVHEIATSPAMWSTLHEMDLPIRVVCYGHDWDKPVPESRNPRLRFGGFKVFLDGALGSRGAWLREPYDDDLDTKGLHLLSREELFSWWYRAQDAGLQLAVHAIGDAAVSAALSLPHQGDCSLRIEHAQVVAPEDLPRFRGVVAAMQPHHRRDDSGFLDARLGARAAWAFRFVELANAGAVVSFGSDAPVSTLSPVAGMAAADEAGVGRPWRGYTDLARRAARGSGGTFAVGEPLTVVALDGEQMVYRRLA